MANNEKITEIIDDKAFQQIERLSSLLVTAQGDLVKSIEVAAKFNNEISKSKSITDFAANQDKAAKAIANTQKATERIRLEEIKLSQAREKAFDNYEKKLSKQIESVNKRERQAEINNKRELDRIAKESKANEALEARQAKEASANSKRITEQSRVYNQLSAVLEKNRKDAKDIGIIYGENSFQFKQAAKSVIELDARLKSLDAKLGQSQRNVGNYKSGFNGLSNSINQITRELPAFTFSAQTGFLALSNNIPILFDNIQQTSKEIAALRAQGEKVPGLFKQLATSFFSFGTALSIGITLFTIYGKEIGNFVSALFKGTDALDAFTQAQNERNRSAKAFNQTILEGTQNAQKELVSLNVTKAAIENENIPREERNKLVDNLQKEYPKYFGNLTNEQILAGAVGDKYRQLSKDILSAALARAAQDKIVENSSRILQNELAIETERINNLKLRAKEEKLLAQANEAFRNRSSGQSSLTGGGAIVSQESLAAGAATKAAKEKAKSDRVIFDLTSDTKKLNQDNLKLYGKINTEVEKTGASALLGVKASEEKLKSDNSLLELEKFRAENSASINKIITDNDKANFDDRFSALEIYLQSKEKALDIERKIALTADDLTNNDRIRIQEEFIAKRSQLDSEGSVLALKIFQDQLDEQDKARLNANKKEISDLEIQKDISLQALDQEYSEGKIKKEQYERDKLEIAKIYNQLIIQEQIKQTEAEIALNKSRGLETADAEAKLAQLKIKYSKEATDAKIRDAESVAEAQKKLNDLEKELAQETANLIIGFVQGNFQKKIETIDLEKEKETEKADFEREQVNESILSADEKQIALAQIDAREQARQAALDEKKKQIQIKAARFQKAVDALKIITAQGVAQVQALTYLSNPITAPLYPSIATTIGVIGALQLATVLGTPIPAFEDGGTMKKTGLALFGEVGTEGRLNPDGSFELTPSVPTIGQVQAGTQFISNKDLMNMIAKPEKVNYVGGQQIDMKEVIDALDKNGNKTALAIKNLPINNYQITAKGMKKRQKNINGWNTYINNNFN